MRCQVCGNDSGKYPLCRSCNIIKEQGKIIKCPQCNKWHYADQKCFFVVENEAFVYNMKKMFISASEQSFYNAICAVVPEGYRVFPQANLATFISKTDNTKYINELFRNVDFLITDSKYKPLMVIEINDKTHLNPERIERDKKVTCILEEAGMPKLTLWTDYGVNCDYIRKRIMETLSAPIVRKHHATVEQKEKHAESINQNKQFTQLNGWQRRRQKQGCYIASCVYGSYDCPQVWILRRYRDNCLNKHFIGRFFISFYYTVSPILVSLFGKTRLFKGVFSFLLDKKIAKLQKEGFSDTPYNDPIY